jgi:signal transduction histidine kinase
METDKRRNLLLQLEHETRTPLNAIVGFSSITIESYASCSKREIEEYLSYVERSGIALTGIIGKMVSVLSSYDQERIFDLERKARTALNVIVNYPQILKYLTNEVDNKYLDLLSTLVEKSLEIVMTFKELNDFIADKANDEEVSLIIESKLTFHYAKPANEKKLEFQESNRELNEMLSACITPSKEVAASLIKEIMQLCDNQMEYICKAA